MLIFVFLLYLTTRTAFAAGQLARAASHSIQMQSSFSRVYEEKIWGVEGEGSGPGSDLKSTVEIRKYMTRMIQEYNIISMLDAPCGSFHWMPAALPSIFEIHPHFEYTGADIVSSVIANNKEKHPEYSFFEHDIANDFIFKKYDLIMARDVFIHLKAETIMCAVANFQISQSVYLFTTTYPSVKDNIERHHVDDDNENMLLDAGAYRPLNLQIPPYNFPAPLQVMQEEDGNGKAIALWRLGDLQRFSCSE
jgi:hypothetical protein